jgi:hypothetical protein
MTVPTSVEILLAQQIFWIQRRAYEARNDPNALLSLAELLRANIIYITGDINKIEEKVKLPYLDDTMLPKEKAKIVYRYVMSLLNLTMDLAREWIDQKRRMMI